MTGIAPRLSTPHQQVFLGQNQNRNERHRARLAALHQLSHVTVEVAEA